MSKGFGYRKCSSQSYKSIPTVSNKICCSRSIKVSEILPVVILWLLGCRQGLQPNASLSLLTYEVTADVSAQEIFVLSWVRLSLTLEHLSLFWALGRAYPVPGDYRHAAFTPMSQLLGRMEAWGYSGWNCSVRNIIFISMFVIESTAMWSSDLVRLLLGKALILACYITLWALNFLL